MVKAKAPAKTATKPDILEVLYAREQGLTLQSDRWELRQELLKVCDLLAERHADKKVHERQPKTL
jgi:hypothetical protein